jgi:hypothetical protein
MRHPVFGDESAQLETTLDSPQAAKTVTHDIDFYIFVATKW